MKHLTVDEMLQFVSLTELNDDALTISAAVNGHVRHCDQCLKRVRAFQILHDEFVRIKGSGDFRKFIESRVRTSTRLAVASAEPTELEGYE